MNRSENEKEKNKNTEHEKSQTHVMNPGGQKEDSSLHSHTNLRFDYTDE
jgi:hypothetical protein